MSIIILGSLIHGLFLVVSKSKGELNIQKLRYEHSFLFVDESETEANQLQGAINW